jgi:predicted TIM-barrel fold metal-dependent hydrolase
MDDAGITVQVLSNSGPGPDLVPGPDGVAMAREMNDHLATAIARHPDRLAGFAALPMRCPDACADELVRAVCTAKAEVRGRVKAWSFPKIFVQPDSAAWCDG